MKTKEEIVANWLPRYTKRNLEDFGEYILLTNFNKYVEIFANQFDVPILGRDANMISASAGGITMINFGENLYILVEVSQQYILDRKSTRLNSSHPK